MKRLNPITALDAASPVCLHAGRQWRGAIEFCRWALAMRTGAVSVFLAIIMLVFGCRPARWVELDLDHGNFTFSMPAQPMPKVHEMDLPLGHITMFEYALTTNDITFMLNYTDYPEAMTAGKSADDMLDPGLDKTFAAHPRARSERAKIVLQGFPARRFKSEDPDTGYTVIGQSCLVGHRIYLVQAVMPTKLSGRPEAQRFMSSLRFRPSGGQGD